MNNKNTCREDTDLVHASKKGDKRAFGELVSKYQHRVFNTIFRLVNDYETANDLTQEAFLNAFRGIDKFKEQATFFTWLFRISLNLANGALRQNARRKGTTSLEQHESDNPDSSYKIEPVAKENNPSQQLEQQEQTEMVQKAIATLEEPFRTTLILRDIEGLSYEDIQEITECPLGTVRSRLHRARLMLRDSLKDLSLL